MSIDIIHPNQMKRKLELLEGVCKRDRYDFQQIKRLIAKTSPYEVGLDQVTMYATVDGRNVQVDSDTYNHGDLSLPRDKGYLQKSPHSYAAAVAFKNTGLRPHFMGLMELGVL